MAAKKKSGSPEAAQKKKPTPPAPPKPRSRYAVALDAAARAEILAAVRETQGRRTDAARALGLSVRTLYREIHRLDLWAELERLADEQGWTRWEGYAKGHPGRPS
jgi:transcriptional regulator of acetoin/glycerol metabolism